MEIVVWVANHILSLALGFGGGWAYFQYRFWKIRAYPVVTHTHYI